MIKFTPDTKAIARDQLRSIVERIERLHEEAMALSEDTREVYAEAKANGFDTEAIRQIIKIRGQDTAERQEFEAIVETYMHALGMLPEEPPARPQRARVENPSFQSATTTEFPPQSAPAAVPTEPPARSSETSAGILSDQPLKSPAAVASTHPVSVAEETAGAPLIEEDADDYPVMPVFLRRRTA